LAALPLLLVSISVFAVGIDRATFWWRWWLPPGQGRRQLAEQLKAMACQQYQQLDLELLANPMTHGEQLRRAALACGG
jgi:hypothetical protein